jgi:hypothetical protein
MLQDQTDARVEGIAGLRAPLMSVSRRIVELEGNKEQRGTRRLRAHMLPTAYPESAGARIAYDGVQGGLGIPGCPTGLSARPAYRSQQEKGTRELLSDPLLYGSPYGIRTRATGVRGRRPRPLDERAI